MTLNGTSLLVLTLLVAAASCILVENVDILQPIRRTVQDLGGNSDDYFGYSVAFHQLQANPSNPAGQSRIVVSAPMHNIPGAAVENTGAVFTCPIGPGSCSPLTGDGNGADNRLYDMEPNNANNKTNQFLGSSMASNGDWFIVCAHRYKPMVSGRELLRGVCYYSARSLSGFNTYSPCDTFGGTSNGGTGVCTAGSSSVVTGDGVFGVGAPGSYLWRGSVGRFESQTNTIDNIPSTSNDPFALIGYSMTTGRFIRQNAEDYAVSLPRFSQNTYLGRVNIVMNDASLSISSQPLNGQQMGEYYGFSLVGANLAGEGNTFDELVVGAPMYRANGTAPETGRIFVYSNSNGALLIVRTIVGREAFSRFGHALANLGDISGDGFDDIAVSAPFGSGTGTVFIYHSSSTLTLNPQPAQIITGADLTMSLSPAPVGLKGFGTSLVSGVDVDGNTYNDLAIGSFVSREVFVLRTRPLARVASTISTNRPIVDVDMQNCPLGAENYACFAVTTCITYTGDGVNDNLDLTVTLFAERQNLQDNLEQRIFFDNPSAGQFPTSINNTNAVARNTMSCNTVTAYVLNGITDRFNGFIVDAEISTQTYNPSVDDGNQALIDFSEFPVVSTSGQTMIQIETFKDCSGGTCVPDLQVSVGSVDYIGTSGEQLTELTVGAVSRINVLVDIANVGDDAFQAVLSFTFATNQLQVERVYNISSDLTLTCAQETFQDASSVQFTRFNCSIGNPLIDNARFPVNIAFSPRPELIGNEMSVTLDISVSSVNPEDGTLADNVAQNQMTVNALADVSLGRPGVVFPASVSYANFAPNGTIVNATQLGPSVQTTFTVTNAGPSPIPTTRLVINWPLNGTETGAHDFLYPASITATAADSTVVCQNQLINRNGFELPAEFSFVEDDQSVTPGGKRRRRRRSVPSVGRKLVKRQEPTSGDTNNDDRTEDRTFSCADVVPTLNCVEISCDILGLQGGSSAQIALVAFVDERYFAERNDRFTFIPTASVEIINAPYITSSSGNSNARTSSAEILAIPAGVVNPVDIPPPPFPWYAVVFPIIAIIIIIAVVAVILYFAGFFRRTRHEEIKQKREELQNLADNAVEPSKGEGGDGTNL